MATDNHGTDTDVVSATIEEAEAKRLKLRAPGINMALPIPRIEQLAWLRPQLPQIKFPPRDRMLFYAGMGALAVAEVIEWPVALAIVASQAVARRALSDDKPEPGASRATAGDSGGSTTAKPPAAAASRPAAKRRPSA